uniref:Uncharacterized protein n=1 Tax=Oryza sativa subsp. japonica TaxID=39947 RepID=Q2R308_ORYSJ|nr:hypothetical protein LOC_Os11g34040 [Oryza sativa Japonica Group]
MARYHRMGLRDRLSPAPPNCVIGLSSMPHVGAAGPFRSRTCWHSRAVGPTRFRTFNPRDRVGPAMPIRATAFPRCRSALPSCSRISNVRGRKYIVLIVWEPHV